MSVVVVTPPTSFVTVAEANAHLRLDDNAQDAYVQNLIDAACQTLDGRNGWLGRAIGEQVLEWRGACFDLSGVVLPYPPVTEIVSVSYLNRTGNSVVLDPTAYSLDDSTLFQAIGSPALCTAWRKDAVRIRFKAGYPTINGKSTIPAPIKQAALVIVAMLFEGRIGGGAITDDKTVQGLLNPLRLLRLV